MSRENSPPAAREERWSAETAQPASLRLRPEAAALILSVAFLALLLAHAFCQYLRFAHGRPTLFGLTRLFDFDRELNAPTFFSSTLLLIAATALAALARLELRAGARWGRHWALLAAGFLYLSLDEAAYVHESIGNLLGRFVIPSAGLFFHLWVIPALVVLPLVVLIFLPFWLALPRADRLRMLAAGGLYLGGAIGVELLEGARFSERGAKDAGYALLATLEESMEMAGAILFVYAVLCVLRARHGALTLRLDLPAGGAEREVLSAREPVQPPARPGPPC